MNDKEYKNSWGRIAGFTAFWDIITAVEERFSSKFSDFRHFKETYKTLKHPDAVQLDILKQEVYHSIVLTNFEKELI